MKVIVVGCGKIGYTIAKVLSEKKNIHVTVVDNNPDIFDDSAEPIDVILIAGNGVNEKTLNEAGAQYADLIVSTTHSDELNVLCCIMAKRLGTKHSIARVRDPEYMLEFNKLWKDLGIDMVINPERQTAREISRMLRYPAADDIATFMNGRVELVSFKVSEAPEFFLGKTVSQVFNSKMGILLAIVDRENKAMIPDGAFVFEKSDIVGILGRPFHIMKFLTHIKKKPKKAQAVMIIGGGRITRYLTELLNRHTIKTNIKIIEKDRLQCDKLHESLALADVDRHCMLIHGDGTNEDLLIAEEIESMDAVICLTDRDEENAIISLYASHIGVKKVISKINHIHQNMIQYLGLGKNSIITPQNITSAIVVRYVDGLTGVIGSNIRTMHRVFSGDDGNVEAIDFQAAKRAKCMGIPIKNLKIRKGTLIACIVRDTEIILPSGETQIQFGDGVMIITNNNDIRELDDIVANKSENLSAQ